MISDSAWSYQLLYHPAIHSGVLPFVLALLGIAIPVGKAVPRCYLAVLLAFTVSAGFTLGGFMLPLTSTSKLILGVIVAFLVFIRFAPSTRRHGLLLGLFAIALPLWMLWPVIQRQGWGSSVQYGLIPLYTLYLAYSLGAMQAHARDRLASLFALSIGTGHCVLIGASIVYAQLALGLGAGLAALALWYLVRTDGRVIHHLVAPVAIAIGTIGGGATVFADLPIATLLILAFVPQMVRLPVPAHWGERTAFALVSGYCLLPVIAALIFVWNQAGPVGY